MWKSNQDITRTYFFIEFGKINFSHQNFRVLNSCSFTLLLSLYTIGPPMEDSCKPLVVLTSGESIDKEKKLRCETYQFLDQFFSCFIALSSPIVLIYCLFFTGTKENSSRWVHPIFKMHVLIGRWSAPLFPIIYNLHWASTTTTKIDRPTFVLKTCVRLLNISK